MRRQSNATLFCIGVLLLVAAGGAEEKAEKSDKTMEGSYPGLASGALTFAKIGELPDGVLLRAETVDIKAADLEQRITGAPKEVQEQLKKNRLFVLEDLATAKMLSHLARKDAVESKAEPSGKTERDVIQAYLSKVVKPVEVTDAEVSRFYEENKDMCGGATLDQVKTELKQYVLGEKRQKAVTEHIRNLGNRIQIQVSGAWLKEQAVLAKDNPVDKARASGKPSLVDFGASGCRPCDMMAPVLEMLKAKYAEKANVLFVHVREEQILAARYGIQSIPVQVFYDKDGKEVFRHTGFFPQDEIEKKLAEMGVQ